MARMLGGLVWAAMMGLVMSAWGADELPRARDFQRDGRGHKPIMVLFSRSDCAWCVQARRYLAPMAQEGASATGALYRQVDVDSDAPLVDFQGQNTSHRAWAAAEKVSLTPTVAAYGPKGQRLAPPLLGIRVPDFYADYLQQTLRQAQQALAQTQP